MKTSKLSLDIKNIKKTSNETTPQRRTFTVDGMATGCVDGSTPMVWYGDGTEKQRFFLNLSFGQRHRAHPPHLLRAHQHLELGYTPKS